MRGDLWRPTGSPLGLHSLKLLFYKAACSAQKAGPARQRKERGGAVLVMDATVAEQKEKKKNTTMCTLSFESPKCN